MRLQARPPGRFPRLVLGDGGVDLGFLDLLGGSAVPQGLQRVAFVQRNHDSGFATETDDVRDGSYPPRLTIGGMDGGCRPLARVRGRLSSWQARDAAQSHCAVHREEDW